MADIRVLVVLDGDRFTFGPRSSTVEGVFSVSKLIEWLQGSVSPTISVDTAHRRASHLQAGDTAPTITGDFLFTQLDLSVYDVIWLIGDEGYNVGGLSETYFSLITDDENIKLAQFMEGGGGVFATGDHDGIGQYMCGAIPRVRVMRKWYEADKPHPPELVGNWSAGAITTSPNDPAQPRFDTLQPDSADNRFYFYDQSDPTPQTLTLPSGSVHPILQGSHGPIVSWPDHMHEGEATDLTTISSSGNPLVVGDLHFTGQTLGAYTVTEFPTVAGHQEVPLVIASGTEIAGHQTLIGPTTYIPTQGKTRGTLSVYDGHTVGKGRVLTDSSFHHLLDLNLVGDPDTASSTPGVGPTGSTSGLPQPVIDGMREYFVNAVTWLARVKKTCSFVVQNSTFGKEEVLDRGLNVPYPNAFWVVLDGFLPSELGLDTQADLQNPANRPHVTFSVDPPANTGTIPQDLTNELTVDTFVGPVLTEANPPAPNAPQRFMYPFSVNFSGVSGFQMNNEILTLTATITIAGKQYTATAKLDLTSKANPYFTNEDAGNQYTFWISGDLRVFHVDDNEQFFGSRVTDFVDGPNGYIQHVIQQMTANHGTVGGQSFDHDLTEQEDGRSLIEYLPTNPRTGRTAYNFALCRVRLRGQMQVATHCRVFFRMFQAQSASTVFDASTTYRSTPVVANYGDRVPLLGVVNGEYVTVPFFAVPRVNKNGPADLTTQPADTPNRADITPIPGQEVDTYFGCWLDVNQQTPLFPLSAPPTDPDNTMGTFGTSSYPLHSINDTITRGTHQCLVAEIAFDDVPIPPGADTSTSDKLAQRNLAWIDGPNPGVDESRRMPHPIQIKPTAARVAHLDELMIAWGNTPKGSTADLYLPDPRASDIITLADTLYGHHSFVADDAHTLRMQTGGVTFVPIPRGAGLLAGLLTVDLPAGIRRGERFAIVVRQITDAVAVKRGAEMTASGAVREKKKSGKSRAEPPKHVGGQKSAIVTPNETKWRRVLGAFQINLAISTKQQLLVPEERRLAFFRSIALAVPKKNRWHPVLNRYVDQIAGRVSGFGGDPGKIPPSPIGHLPGDGRGHGGDHDGHAHHDETSGKIDGIVYDHFGDFRGFVLETRRGGKLRFHSREHRVLELVKRAWIDRLVVTVFAEGGEERLVSYVIVGGDPPRER